MSILSKLNVTPARSRDVLTLGDPAAVEAAVTWISAKHAAQSAESSLDISAAALTPLVRAEYFRANVGRAKPCGSVEVPAHNGTVLASFASVWSAKGGVGLLPADLVRERFTIRIDGDALPAAVAGRFVDGLLKLAAACGCPEAVKATGGLAPVPTFNEVRHSRLTLAQNEAVEAAGLGTRLTLRIR